MTNFNLYDDPLDFTPRRPLRIKTRSGADGVVVAARGGDGRPLTDDVWVVQKNQYSALLNVDLERLPSSIIFSLTPATGSPFAVGAQPHFTVQLGGDSVIVSSLEEIGGLPSVDVLVVVIREHGFTLKRAEETIIRPPCLVESSEIASEPSAAAAATARSVLGARNLEPARQRRMVVTVDASGSMKVPGTLVGLGRLLQELCGIAQVVCPDARFHLQLSTARGNVAEPSPTALVEALSAAPFSVGAPLTQPTPTDDGGTAHIVISDEVPYQVLSWRLTEQDSLQVIVVGDDAPVSRSPVLTTHYNESVPTKELVHHVLQSFPERGSRAEGTSS